MKPIVITEERMNEILPKSVKDTDVISDDAKKVFAAILNYYAILNVVQTTRYLICPNSVLRESVKIKNNNMLSAVQELIECGLIEREIGQARVEGQKGIASKYTIIWDALKKPLKKKNTFEELFADFLTGDKSSETSMGTAVSVTDTVTVSDTVYDIDNVIEIENDNEIEDVVDTESVTEVKNESVNVSDSFLKDIGKNKFQLLEEFIEECYKNVNTYQDSVSQIGLIHKWIKDRYSSKSNVESLTSFANGLINKKLDVFKTVS